MENTSKIVLKGAIMNCGLATALINAVICYFTLAKVSDFTIGALNYNFLGVAVGCGVLCPLFGGVILKPLQQKNELHFRDKSEHFLARLLPNQSFLAALIIGVMSAVLFWGIPSVVTIFIGDGLALSRTMACVVLGIYSGFVATFAAYLGVHRAYYANLMKK